nr:HNH endonuclease family protein [Dermacoccus nishinomiyaensis]
MLIRRVYSTPRSQRYVELLKQLHEGSGLESPAFELTDEELTATRERLDGELYLVRPVRKYVLMRLDSLLAADPGATYDHRVITVEHVLPQRPEPNSGWTQKFDEETAAHWVHRLGNLLLLNRRKNSEASNYDFEMKKHKYFTSTKGVSVFPLTTQVLQEEAWTPEVVQRRHKRLTSLLHDEWRL